MRLYAIDAPEGRQKYGREATNHLRNLTNVERFWLKTKNQDPHGRTIAIVYKDGNDAEHTLNYAMVRDGARWMGILVQPIRTPVQQDSRR